MVSVMPIGRRPWFGKATVAPTIVYYNGERLAPDRVHFRHASVHDFAARGDADRQIFAHLLDGTPMRILRTADFDTLAWRTLLINAVANPITPLTLQRQAVFRREDINALCRDVLGRTDGASPAPDEVDQVLATLLTYPTEAGTSMYFDRLAGRSFEMEALTGTIVKAGEQYQIPTPLNKMLLTHLHAIALQPTPNEIRRRAVQKQTFLCAGADGCASIR